MWRVPEERGPGHSLLWWPLAVAVQGRCDHTAPAASVVCGVNWLQQQWLDSCWLLCGAADERLLLAPAAAYQQACVLPSDIRGGVVTGDFTGQLHRGMSDRSSTSHTGICLLAVTRVSSF